MYNTFLPGLWWQSRSALHSQPPKLFCDGFKKFEVFFPHPDVVSLLELHQVWNFTAFQYCPLCPFGDKRTWQTKCCCLSPYQNHSKGETAWPLSCFQSKALSYLMLHRAFWIGLFAIILSLTKDCVQNRNSVKADEGLILEGLVCARCGFLSRFAKTPPLLIK